MDDQTKPLQIVLPAFRFWGYGLCHHSSISSSFFISLMLVSGDHIMNDIMATEPDEDGELSWALEMKNEGFVTDTLTITVQGKKLYQGLGFNKEIVALFTRSIQHSLEKIDTN